LDVTCKARNGSTVLWSLHNLDVLSLFNKTYNQPP
jgi:hypothetical protein